MTTASAMHEFSLNMNRTYSVSKQDVFEAWTDVDALTNWFAPSAEFTTVVHELELCVGGKYRIEMIEPDGVSHKIHGEYITIKPFDQLVFTWEWESDDEKVNSLVTIDLSEKDGKTDMVLTHEKLASQESVDLHAQGWTGCLAQLEVFLKI